MTNNVNRFSRMTVVRQGGFTLLEALISLVVLSIGMLGIAAMNVEGMRASRTAVFRTTAVALAGDMMDRVRANPAGQAAYAGPAGLNNCVNNNNDCTSLEMAQHDLQLWQDEIAARMPPGTAADIEFLPGGVVDTYRIRITWPEAGHADPLSYILVARL